VCSIRNSEKHGQSLLCTTTVVHDKEHGTHSNDNIHNVLDECIYEQAYSLF